jgi:hypothetical protein
MDWVPSVTDLPKMVEDSLNSCPSPVQLSGKQHVVYGEVLHAMLEGVKGEGHLHIPSPGS